MTEWTVLVIFTWYNYLGRYVSAIGDVYIGNFKDSEINGYGEYNYANGDLYKGFWIDELKHGFGTFIDKEGMLYEGHFDKGLKSDKKGKLELVDGTLFIGEYRDNKRNGHG